MGISYAYGFHYWNCLQWQKSQSKLPAQVRGKKRHAEYVDVIMLLCTNICCCKHNTICMYCMLNVFAVHLNIHVITCVRPVYVYKPLHMHVFTFIYGIQIYTCIAFPEKKLMLINGSKIVSYVLVLKNLEICNTRNENWHFNTRYTFDGLIFFFSKAANQPNSKVTTRLICKWHLNFLSLVCLGLSKY